MSKEEEEPLLDAQHESYFYILLIRSKISVWHTILRTTQSLVARHDNDRLNNTTMLLYNSTT